MFVLDVFISEPCPSPYQIGEIWVNSPSKAAGYWGRPDLTEQDFHARLGQTDPDAIHKEEADYATAASAGYLRTGDLGFMHDKELFICGRLKDLIIIRGSNHYPQDMERLVESLSPNLRPGCSAIFSIALPNGSTEGVVMVAEVGRAAFTC